MSNQMYSKEALITMSQEYIFHLETMIDHLNRDLQPLKQAIREELLPRLRPFISSKLLYNMGFGHIYLIVGIESVGFSLDNCRPPIFEMHLSHEYRFAWGFEDRIEQFFEESLLENFEQYRPEIVTTLHRIRDNKDPDAPYMVVYELSFKYTG